MQNTYGLIGYPLSHSFSQKYFTDKFEKLNLSQSHQYKLFPIESIDGFHKILSEEGNLKGLNVTIPYKESIIPLLDQCDDVASTIGAVNCIKIENGKTTGYNTDAYGFKQMIKPFIETQHERALILGTGGASKAVAYVLKGIGIDVYYASRLGNNDKIFSYEQLNSFAISNFKLIVNTTPLGMYPNLEETPSIDLNAVGDSHLLVDLIYNPEQTKFLKVGKERGAKVLNGLGMLYAQADRAWEIWQK